MGSRARSCGSLVEANAAEIVSKIDTFESSQKGSNNIVKAMKEQQGTAVPSSLCFPSVCKMNCLSRDSDVKVVRRAQVLCPCIAPLHFEVLP